ncbi:MAG: M16 family metallopeptidase [Vicinamibacterales bacterium]
MRVATAFVIACLGLAQSGPAALTSAAVAPAPGAPASTRSHPPAPDAPARTRSDPPAPARTRPHQSAPAPHWTDGVRRVTLENGLTVLMLQRGTLPIVSVQALYKVGSRNEWPGVTGSAHYIEHMAFRRTERINKGDLTNQVLRWGGRWGGYTSYDQTVYNAHAPSEYLDWLIFMERQRMRHVLFDADSVELERTSVISELRQYENSPSYTMAEHRLRRAAMVAHPYGSPIMGWISDLQAVTPADLERFYRDYYAANNLVLVIVGRFDEAEALGLVRKHFADAPADGRPTRLHTVEPPQTGARRVVHRGPGSASHLELLVHAPAAGDARYPTLLVLDGVLAGGKAEGRASARPGSRLHAALVGTGLAYGVSTEVELSEYPGLHAIGMSAAPDADLAKVEAALDQALTAAARDVTDAEVAAATQQVLSAFSLRDDSNRTIADRLARFEGIGSYTLLPRIVDAVGKVRAADVRALAAQLFAADRRNVGWFVPKADAAMTTSGQDATAPQESAKAPPEEIAQKHPGTVTPPAPRLDLPTLPSVSLTTLPNGLTVGVAPLGGEIVHVRARVAAGALNDPAGREGLAVVVARAMTARGAEAHAAQLGSRGIRIASSASSLDEPFDNRTFVEWTATMRRDDLQAVLTALADVLARPAFATEAVTRARDGLADEAASLQDDSRWRANDAAWSALFPASHPLGRPVHGRGSGLSAITAGDASRFHRTHYRPARTIVTVAGGVSEKDALAAVAQAFGAWPGEPVPATAGDKARATPGMPEWPAAATGGGRDVHISMPHKEQASITVALPAAGPDSPDYPALSLLNYLLGETGYAGRLGERLVDTGIAYAVYASLWPNRGAGPLLVTTDATMSREAVARMRDTLASFATRGVTASQLDEAKGFALGRLLFRFETPASASAAVADLASLGQGADGLRAFGERIRAVTVAQLNATAAKYYAPERAVFVVAGR